MQAFVELTGNFERRAARPTIDGRGFGGIVERCAGPVGVDVIDFPGRQRRVRASQLHRLKRRIALGLRLRQVVAISRRAVTSHAAENRGMTTAGRSSDSRIKNRRALAQRQSVAARVERAALGG